MKNIRVYYKYTRIDAEFMQNSFAVSLSRKKKGSSFSYLLHMIVRGEIDLGIRIG